MNARNLGFRWNEAEDQPYHGRPARDAGTPACFDQALRRANQVALQLFRFATRAGRPWYASLLLLFAVSASAAPTTAPSTLSLKLADINGVPINLADPSVKATAVIFVGTECPVANKSIVKLNYLSRSFQKGNWPAKMYAVLSDPRVGRKQAQDWAKERGVAFPVIFDTTGELAMALKPTHTPDAFVLDAQGNVVYQGRIDDTVPKLGTEKHDANSYDLAAAVTDVLQGRPVKVARTESIGCIFESWNEPRNAESPVTFARDIAPIVYANCIQCHRDGEVAPFALTSYEDVSKRAKMIAAVTESRYMPPWKPKQGFGHFQDERRLTDRQIELIQQWADAGAPLGDRADLPPEPKFASGWRLGEPDIVAKVAEPFKVPAAGRDVYRAFVIPLDVKQDEYVAAVEFRPGAPTVVHHAIFYLDTRGAARQKDAADPQSGYVSFGGPGFVPSGALGGWAPGGQPHRLPDGVGRVLPKGSDLVVQVHYHPDGVERIDQSTVAIYLQKKPVHKLVSTIALVNRDINIPPGDANYTRSAQFTLPMAATINGVMPHMHLLGKEMVVSAVPPTGDPIPLIHIDDWDFRCQDQYKFAEPITLPAGTILQMTARYDNSSDNPNNPSNPPQRVRRGEQTTDEMCMAFIEYLADSPADIRTMRRAMIGQKLLEAIDKE